MENVLTAPSWQSKQAVKGWGASLVLHACLVLAALGFMPKMAVLVQQEPFTWNVALVESQPVESTAQEAAPIKQAQPAPPVKPPRQSVRAVQPASQPVQRQVETRVAPQPVQRLDACFRAQATCGTPHANRAGVDDRSGGSLSVRK